MEFKQRPHTSKMFASQQHLPGINTGPAGEKEGEKGVKRTMQALHKAHVKQALGKL